MRKYTLLAIAVLIGLVGVLESRHFLPARQAPAGEEVENDWLAAVLAQSDISPLLEQVGE